MEPGKEHGGKHIERGKKGERLELGTGFKTPESAVRTLAGRRRSRFSNGNRDAKRIAKRGEECEGVRTIRHHKKNKDGVLDGVRKFSSRRSNELMLQGGSREDFCINRYASIQEIYARSGETNGKG